MNQNKKDATVVCKNFVNLLLTQTLKQSFLRLSHNMVEKEVILQRVRQLFIRARRSKIAPYFTYWKSKGATISVVAKSQVSFIYK